jgi:hypothetical protein
MIEKQTITTSTGQVITLTVYIINGKVVKVEYLEVT